MLGIQSDSNVTCVKKSFREKAAKWHPDKNPNDQRAAEMFQKLSDAKNVLCDLTLRANYDKEWRKNFKFKIFKCNICDQGLKGQDRMTEHLRIHEQQKQFAHFQNYKPKEKKNKNMRVKFNFKHNCKFCGKSFN